MKRRKSREKAKTANIVALGAQIQSLRKSKGLSRKELCERAGVSSAFLYDLEHGLLENPSMRHTEAVALELGLNLVTLFTMSQQDSADSLVLRFNWPKDVPQVAGEIAKAQRVMQEVLNAIARENADSKKSICEDNCEES